MGFGVSNSCNKCNTLPGSSEALKHWNLELHKPTRGPPTCHKPEMMRVPPLANHHQKPMIDVKATIKALLRLQNLSMAKVGGQIRFSCLSSLVTLKWIFGTP